MGVVGGRKWRNNPWSNAEENQNPAMERTIILYYRPWKEITEPKSEDAIPKD